MSESDSVIALIKAHPDCVKWYQQGKWEGIMKAVTLLRQCGRWPKNPSKLADDLEYAAMAWKPKQDA